MSNLAVFIEMKSYDLNQHSLLVFRSIVGYYVGSCVVGNADSLDLTAVVVVVAPVRCRQVGIHTVLSLRVRHMK